MKDIRRTRLDATRAAAQQELDRLLTAASRTVTAGQPILATWPFTPIRSA